MKRIKARVRTCDRVIARKTNNCISLYYVDTQSKNEQNIYLHSVKFSPSIENYFGHKGKTLSQLYRFKRWDNEKLAKLISRLPGLIDAALEDCYGIEKQYECVFER